MQIQVHSDNHIEGSARLVEWVSASVSSKLDRFDEELTRVIVHLHDDNAGKAGADFAQVAKDNSTCPSSRSGGDLGSFGPGQMVKEFDTVVFSAPINEVQGPLKTQFGYHLLEVTSRQDGLTTAHASRGPVNW